MDLPGLVDEDDASATVTAEKQSKRQIEDDKRARRLERNRESARASRKRKKQYLELLQTRVRELRLQVDRIRSTHCASAEKDLHAQSAKLLQKLVPLAYQTTRTTHEDALLKDGVAQLVDRFGPNCAERQAARNYQFQNLKFQLMSPTTQFALWLSHHTAATPESDESVALFWRKFADEIGLTAEQATSLRKNLARSLTAPELGKEVWRVQSAIELLDSLQEAVDARAQIAQSQMESLRSILDPDQFVRYWDWYYKHHDDVMTTVETAPIITESTTSLCSLVSASSAC